jgi:hypothetical protein
LLGFGFLLVTPWQAWAQEAKPGFEPTLRLEKPLYVLGEQVRFWVGMRSTNRTPIPLDKPCTISITRPDGSNETESVGPPPDRILGATFSEGGMGLGDKIQPGRYVLVWACSGQKTKPVVLMVEKNEIWDQLRAEFRFERSGNVKMGTSVPVVLSVQNNSSYTIRFPERGVNGAEISVGAIRESPSSYTMTFYPADKLSHADTTPATYNWDASSWFPTVVVKPGEHFEQKFLFEDAYKFDQPGTYKVMFSTVLEVLVGEKSGPFAPVCPIRLPASAVEQLIVVK